MDLKTGSVTYAAPEHLLITMAFSEISNFLGLPSYIPMVHPDSEELDFQAGGEMMMGFMSLLSCSPTLLTGVGSLSKTRLASFEKLFTDIEFYKMAKRFYEGMETDKRHLAYRNMKKVRKEGSYLMDELTLKEMRRGEHFIPDLLNREIRGGKNNNIFSRAKNKVAYVIKDHKSEVDEKIISLVEDFFYEKKKKLKILR